MISNTAFENSITIFLYFNAFTNTIGYNNILLMQLKLILKILSSSLYLLSLRSQGYCSFVLPPLLPPLFLAFFYMDIFDSHILCLLLSLSSCLALSSSICFTIFLPTEGSDGQHRERMKERERKCGRKRE